jgi:hypothetical protein
MTKRILRRCTICQKHQASYLVHDSQLGSGYLCYTCCQARQAASGISSPEQNAGPVDEQAKTRPISQSNEQEP